jgi:hypothetical protein
MRPTSRIGIKIKDYSLHDKFNGNASSVAKLNCNYQGTITLKALANLSPGFALKPWV